MDDKNPLWSENPGDSRVKTVNFLETEVLDQIRSCNRIEKPREWRRTHISADQIDPPPQVRFAFEALFGQIDRTRRVVHANYARAFACEMTYQFSPSTAEIQHAGRAPDHFCEGSDSSQTGILDRFSLALLVDLVSAAVAKIVP